VTVRSESTTLPRAFALPRPPAWLLGWWLAGRIVVLATAFAIRPSVRILNTWDGRWYWMVAHGGYLLVPGRGSDPAFFPLYPILLRAVHALGAGWGVAGPLLSNLALLVGLIVFHALTRELFSEGFARRATVYLAVFPLGYVFSMRYPESVAVLLIAAAPLAALRRRWWLAAACGAAAALARPEGVFIALPLLEIAWQQRRILPPVRLGAAVAAVLAPAAALASYPLYLGSVLHDPLAWSRAQHAWGRAFSPLGPLRAFERLPASLAHVPWKARDVAFLFLYLALLYAARRDGTSLPWIAAGVAIVVLPLFSGVFDSIARFGLLAPPLFWGLAATFRSRRIERIFPVVSLLLLALATASIQWIFP
jgi:hypothetical protein